MGLAEKVEKIKDTGLFSEKVINLLEKAVEEGIETPRELQSFLEENLKSEDKRLDPAVIAALIEMIGQML